MDCCRTKIGQQFGPAKTGLGRPRQAVDSFDATGEPPFQPLATGARGQQQNPESDLAENDRVDNKIAFVFAQPVDDLPLRRGLGRLAQDVGVNEVSHKVSVDSESMGTK
jgi:hypothetical protein